jgi:hypothetical protein
LWTHVGHESLKIIIKVAFTKINELIAFGIKLDDTLKEKNVKILRGS